MLSKGQKKTFPIYQTENDLMNTPKNSYLDQWS